MVSEEVSQSIDMGLKALREGIFQPQVKFSEFFKDFSCLLGLNIMGVFADFLKSFFFMQGSFGEPSLMAPTLELAPTPPPSHIS
jgi:hypothetical protein